MSTYKTIRHIGTIGRFIATNKYLFSVGSQCRKILFYKAFPVVVKKLFIAHN
jgi:hypothetical protein